MYETEMEIENLAFKLFSKQMELSKKKNQAQPTEQIEEAVISLKREVD